MTTFRVAVVDDDDVVFQFQDAVFSSEDAQAKVAAAKAEYKGKTVRVERLDIEGEGDTTTGTWNEVTD